MQNSITVVLGKKGSGKSTLVGEIIKSNRRVVVLDALAEYDMKQGCAVVWESDCVDAIVERYRSNRKFKLSCRCIEVEDNLALMRVLYECPGILIAIEETSLYCSPSNLPSELARLIRYGRHKELDLVLVSRRASELHRDITANADNVVTFRQQEPRDIQYLKSFFGDDALTLQNLPDYHIKVYGDMKKSQSAVLERITKQTP